MKQPKNGFILFHFELTISQLLNSIETSFQMPIEILHQTETTILLQIDFISSPT